MTESLASAIFLMGGLGVVVGICLAAASKIFYVYVDPLVLAVDDVLPGANCGGCGYPGCSSNAEAVVAGKSAPNSCVAAGPEVAEAIAAIMGVAIEATEPDIALPGCYYGVQDADQRYIYNGLNDCRAVAMLGGGSKVCTIGCLGLGTCAQVCPFDAIRMGGKGLPEVDGKKCTGCGTCERVCPKHIINLSSITRRILREYTTEECTTPCQRACPAGINIREYVGQIARGNHKQAVQVIKERNPFPSVIGRICPRPCEDECRRKYNDEPVAINFLKRYCADVERESGSRTLPYRAPATNRKIAVVGGGVAGLSTAFFAARLGHAATVYEAGDKLGGLLRSAVAANRLSMDILDWDIEGILQIGVEAKTGQMLGRDMTIDSLLAEGYEAVFLASGGWDSRLARTRVPDVEQQIPGTYLLLDLLRDGAGGAADVSIGKDVVILGGGQSALEVAKQCRQKGAQTITLINRESWDLSPVDDDALQKAGIDGLKVISSSGIRGLSGTGGQLQAVEVVNLVSGDVQALAAQTLLLASGRYPELIFTRVNEETSGATAEDAVEKSAAIRWSAVTPYKQPVFKEEVGVFAGGDAITDYSAAIKAIGAGRRATVSIHQIISGIRPTLTENVITSEIQVQNVDHVESVKKTKRQIMPLSGAAEAAAGKELELGFDAHAARTEAARCLQCGLICYRHDPIQIKASEPEEAVGA